MLQHMVMDLSNSIIKLMLAVCLRKTNQTLNFLIENLKQHQIVCLEIMTCQFVKKIKLIQPKIILIILEVLHQILNNLSCIKVTLGRQII